MCKKLGHTADQCWFKGKGTPKGGLPKGNPKGPKAGPKGGHGQGQGQGPGKGNGDKDKTCHYCKEKGHIKANCPKFKKDQKAKGQTVNCLVNEGEGEVVGAVVVASSDEDNECGMCLSLGDVSDGLGSFLQ